MTTCKTIQPRLTAYLDGELADDHGSVVRGHLRECAACRQIARDEAGLRDSLRALPPLDPPASLWAGVQARLAAAEVADARAPRWRRVFVLWARWMPSLPRLATGCLAAASAVALLYWGTHRGAPANEVVAERDRDAVNELPAKVLVPRADLSVSPADDVTADLLAEPARTTATYENAIEELMKLASEARGTWSDERSAAFDAKVAALRGKIDERSESREGAHPLSIDGAEAGPAQQRAQRAMIRYLQSEVVRDDVMLASGGAQ